MLITFTVVVHMTNIIKLYNLIVKSIIKYISINYFFKLKRQDIQHDPILVEGRKLRKKDTASTPKCFWLFSLDQIINVYLWK